MDVSARLRALVDLGFLEAGVAPLRGAPDQAGALREADWTVYLHELIRANQDGRLDQETSWSSNRSR
jgi:hypothetical protein